jgi:hypothetical protein
MAHFAEVDENNVVLRVLVGDNDDPNGDEGYQWMVDTFGGTWLKTSYNTLCNEHILGGTPFRGNYAGIGFSYLPDKDIFIEPSPFTGWIIDDNTASWIAPFPKPDSGAWVWDNTAVNWVEYEGA